MKQCSKCKQTKSLADFYVNKSTKDGLYYMCKPCSKEYSKSWHIKNSEARVNRNLKNRYGITAAEKQQMILNQNSMCLICSNELKNEREIHVDHCHETNKIRGILCSKCNLLLGHAKDSIEILKKAIKYLTTNQ